MARVVKDEEHRYATTFQVAEKVFSDESKPLSAELPGAAVVQALRHLRARARRAGRNGARDRRGNRPRRLPSGDATSSAPVRARVGKAPKNPINPAYQALPNQGRTISRQRDDALEVEAL